MAKVNRHAQLLLLLQAGKLVAVVADDEEEEGWGGQTDPLLTYLVYIYTSRVSLHVCSRACANTVHMYTQSCHETIKAAATTATVAISHPNKCIYYDIRFIYDLYSIQAHFTKYTRHHCENDGGRSDFASANVK